MSTLRLKIDVSGTVGDQAWREINQFDQIQSAAFGPQFGSGGISTNDARTAASATRANVETAASAVPRSEARRNLPTDAPYPKGAWIGAEIKLQDRKSVV